MNSGKRWIGVFEDERRLLAAVRAARERGCSIRDVFTPFAVHGLDEAMGLRQTRLGVVCFLFGLVGCSVALGGQLWASAVNWPVNIGGKSHSALPALIPIAFELTVLFASVGTVLTFFLRAGLRPGKPVSTVAPGVTDDRFVVILEEPEGGLPSIRDLLREHGAVEVREDAG